MDEIEIPHSLFSLLMVIFSKLSHDVMYHERWDIIWIIARTLAIFKMLFHAHMDPFFADKVNCYLLWHRKFQAVLRSVDIERENQMRVMMDVNMNNKIRMIIEWQMFSSHSGVDNYPLIKFIFVYLACIKLFLNIRFSKLYVCPKKLFLDNLYMFRLFFAIPCIYLKQTEILRTHCRQWKCVKPFPPYGGRKFAKN